MLHPTPARPLAARLNFNIGARSFLAPKAFGARVWSLDCGGFCRLVPLLLLLLFPTILRAQFNCDEFSLRAAISNALPGDMIVFTQDRNITLTAPLSLYKELTIDGGGNTVTIQGTTGVRVFDITNGANVTLTGLTITGGHASLGAGLYVHNASCTVQLINCSLVANNALGANGINGPDGSTNNNNGGNGVDGFAGQPGRGGAIYNAGALFLYNTLVVSNTTGGGNGGNGGDGGNSIGGNFLSGNGGNGGTAASGVGGGVYNSGTLVVSNCIFSGNTAFGGEGGLGGLPGTNGFAGLPGSGGAGGAGNGAGIYTIGPSNIIVNSTFSDNSAESGASAAGGTSSTGTGVDGAAGPGSFGGGIYVGATGYVANCTFFLDNCFGGNGGNGGPSTGIHNAGNGGNAGIASGGGLYGGASVQVVSCTFSNCNAIAGTNGVAGAGGGASDGTPGLALGGNVARGAGTFKLKYTILATNVSGGAFAGTINDNGYNIYFGTNSLSQSTSFRTNNVRLGPLADNGGPHVGAPGTDLTLTTMRLTNNSPALNRIPTNLVDSGVSTVPLPEFDERGVSRVAASKSKADIGAYASGAPLLQLSNRVATVGSDLTVTVIASGDGPFTYQWLSNNVPIEDATTATLTISDISPDIDSHISVRVTNPFGTVTATLTVNFAPAIVSQPLSQTVQPGNPVTLSVTNTGDLPLTNTWFFRSTNASTFSGIATNRTPTNLIPGNITNWSTITIPSVTGSNLGSYFVVIGNPYGNLTSSVATVTFGQTPVITRIPTSASNNVGSSVTFSVTAVADPAPSYQWNFNTTNIPFATASSYTINNIQAADQGSYTVIVSNNVGVTTSPPAVLTVILPSAPHDLVGPVSQSVTWDSNVIFTVQAHGTTPFTYAWYFNNSPITGAGGSSLQLSHARLPNAGSYYVWVANSIGSVQSDTAVLQVTPPSTKINPSRSNFSFTTVSGFTYIVDYNTNLPSAPWLPLSTNAGTGSSITVPDSLLTPTRFYRVRVQ